MAKGGVVFVNATIGRDLNCDGGRFINTNKGDYALDASGAKIVGSAFLRGHFRAQGEVRLLDANIGGNLDCGDSDFDKNNSTALQADRITVQSVFLNNNFHAQGRVDFASATIRGDLNCEKGSFSMSMALPWTLTEPESTAA